MKRLLIFLAGWLLVALTSSSAQFIVVSSDPADGAVNVQRMTTVSFTFSEPLDTTARFDAGDRSLPISANPNDSIEIDAISYSTDLRTITFQVVNTGDSDFVWVIMGARSRNGEMLDGPFVLNYTTAPSRGPRSVSGTVTVDGGSNTNVIIVLADNPLVGEREGIVKIATIISNPSGTYNLGNVRDGIYWPAAVKDDDRNGSIDPGLGDPYGQYDPDGDGRPDSIVVSGTDRTGIDITLRSISSVPDARMSHRCLTSPPQVSPNPLSPSATIRFSLQTPAHVRLCIVDALGNMVDCLFDEICMGEQSVSFDARNLPDGIYCYQLMAGNDCRSGKMIVMH